MEKLLKEISKFARANREELKLAEQWLNNEFDGELEDVWISVVNPFDWRKVVFIAWLGSDEKIYECKLKIDGFDLRQWCGCDRKEEDIELTPQQNFLYGVISRVEGGYYTTPQNPSFYLIRRALNEGKKAVADESKNNIPDDLIDLAKAVSKFHRSRAQLKRDIDKGDIKSYRKKTKGKHYISESEANRLYLSKNNLA